MKKIPAAGLMIGLLFFPVKSLSQGIMSGQTVANFYVGGGSALNKSGMEVGGQDLSWGNFGGDAGFSYLYFPNPYLALGADIHFGAFQGSESFDEVPGWWYWHTLETDFELYTMNLMGVGRLTVNPGSRARFYIHFGAGITLSEGSMTYKCDDYEIYRSENYDTSFSWYAGMGLEFEAENNLVWGIEARYNAFEHSYEDNDVFCWRQGVK